MATNTSQPHRPTEALANTQSANDAYAQGDPNPVGKRRRNHRAGKKKKNRRQSFLPEVEGEMDPTRTNRNVTEPPTATTARPPFYRLGQSGGRNLSGSSLASEALLDHRYDQATASECSSGKLTIQLEIILSCASGETAE